MVRRAVSLAAALLHAHCVSSGANGTAMPAERTPPSPRGQGAVVAEPRLMPAVVAGCEACGAEHYCLRKLQGEAPASGKSNVHVSCEALPRPCQAAPSCACIGRGANCAVMPGGMLFVQEIWP